MNWIQCLPKAIRYIEEHLTDEINMDAVAGQSYASSSHFQLVFHLVMGMTVGEYIRNRRLSMAAQDLLKPGSKIIDVAMRYQYDTQESFSKAFMRFHGFPPSKTQPGRGKLFYPQCHQLKDATTLKAPKGRHKTGPLFQQIHAQIGARILGDSAN